MTVFSPYYQEDGITIYHGDCRDILPTLEPVDLVLTDPNYGVTQNAWDDLAITKECFDLITVPLVCTCQNPASAELIVRYRKRFKWSDVWEKTQAVGFLNCKVMPMRQHEDILIFASGKIPYYPQMSLKTKANIRPHGSTNASTNYGKYNNTRYRSIPVGETYPRSIVTFANSQGGLHPTQKPLLLFSYLVSSFSTTGDTVLDPFMGSGTTLVAAKQLGRKAIGIEIEEKYCEIAVKRLAQGVLSFES